jgi:hypothetical protein
MALILQDQSIMDRIQLILEFPILGWVVKRPTRGLPPEVESVTPGAFFVSGL